MKSLLLVSTTLAGLALATTAFAQTATGTGTSNSTSNSGSSSGAQGVVGPQGNAINAGTSNANAGSNSNANTRSNSRASSSGNANAQQIQFNSPGQTTSNNTSTNTNNGSTSSANTNNNRDAVSYSGGTNNSSYNRNDGDVTIRTTPTVYAPPVSGGNPCTLAVSGGISVIGWGAAAGGTFVDEDCAMRQKIAMIHNAGYGAAAKELMCNDRATYNAFKTSGQACAFRQAFEAPGAPVQPMPMVQQQPTVVTPPPAPMAAKQYQRCNPRAGIVDNCISG